MAEMWRVIDTGLRPAAQNIALNRALLEARHAEEIPSTLRFLRFAPCALLGYHQSAEQELNLDYCNARAITVQRRITGGGAMYADEGQLGWELYLHRRDLDTADMQAISRRLCHAAATAISALGVDARYRPRNDIEVDGRKIASTGGAFDGDALLFQGTLLLEFDAEKMLSALRIPPEKMSHNAIASVCEHVASLKDLLGRRPDGALVKRYLTEAFESEFGVEFSEGELTLSEHKRFEAALRGIDHPDWVHLVAGPAAALPILEAERELAGGVLGASVAFDILTQTLRHVRFTGDIVAGARRLFVALEATLEDTPLERLEAKVRAFFRGREHDALALTPDDFINVVRLALRQPVAAHKR